MGEDADGEIYFLDFTGGGIYQLVKTAGREAASGVSAKNSARPASSPPPRTTRSRPASFPTPSTPSSGAITPHKERFIAIPGNGQIGFDEITYPQPSPGAPPGWRFPDGTVLVKTFAMDMERGNPKSRKRLETRLLHFQQFPGTQEYGDQYWRGYTYVWNDEQTDAELLEEKGADKVLKIKVGDKIVEQNYRFPSRAECTLCHTNAAKFALGVSTMQMNRDHDYPRRMAGRASSPISWRRWTTSACSPRSCRIRPAKLPKLADFNDDK